MKARLGIAPIAWSNDDLPELGGDTPLEVCLSESREAGFSGTETGGKFPKTPRELKEVLAAHELKLVSGWYSGRVLENDLSAEKDRAHAQLELFRENGASVLVYGETTGTVQNQRDVPLAKRPRLDDEQMRAYGRKLTALRRALPRPEGAALLPPPHGDGDRDGGRRRPPDEFHRRGGRAALRHRPHHLRRRRRAPHGEAPRQAHQPRARQGHPQGRARKRSIRRRQSFLDAVLLGVFTVPGDGMIDFKAVAALLRRDRLRGLVRGRGRAGPEEGEPAEIRQDRPRGAVARR